IFGAVGATRIRRGGVILARRSVAGAVTRISERLAGHGDELPGVAAVLERDLQDPETEPADFAVGVDRDRGDLVHALATGADVDLADPRCVVAGAVGSHRREPL